MRVNKMKQRLMKNGVVFGPNLQIDHPWLVEIIGASGFDFIMLDGEHGMAFHNLPNLIMAADAAGITSIVRVPDHSRAFLNQALEAGAGGVQVPMVNSVAEAQALVQETKFAPLGNRGFSNATRAARYGQIAASDYAAYANEHILLSLQIETKTALAHAAEIAQVLGVDLVFFGPADLAQSLGFAGQSKAPAVVEAIERTIKSFPETVNIGISAFDDDDVRFWKARGVRSFLTGSIHPIRCAFENLARELKQGLED